MRNAGRLIVIASFVALGCGSTSGSGVDGGGACNSLVNGGPQVTKTGHPQAAPPMTGGTIADGTYFLTAADQYNGQQGSNVRSETWVISGGTLQIVATNSEQSGILRLSGTYSTSTNQLQLQSTCPAGMMVSKQYTATSSQFMLEAAGSDQEVDTYTKQ